MIGILGGMGTQAGLDFCNKLAVLNRGKIDQEYPLFLLYNKSNIPGRPESIGSQTKNLSNKSTNKNSKIKYERVLKSLLLGCKLLEKNKCKFIVIPCNTAHHWYDELKTMIPNVVDKSTISKTYWTTPSDLREAIRFAFDSSSSISSQSPLELQTMTVRAIQIMEDQLNLWKQTSSATSSNGLVRITATSRCLGTVSPVAMHAAHSSLTPKYRFAYRIRVQLKQISLKRLYSRQSLFQFGENQNQAHGAKHNKKGDCWQWAKCRHGYRKSQ